MCLLLFINLWPYWYVNNDYTRKTQVPWKWIAAEKCGFAGEFCCVVKISIKAMGDGKGWGHDDKNGNVEGLSSYAQLVSLKRSSVWIFIGRFHTAKWLRVLMEMIFWGPPSSMARKIIKRVEVFTAAINSWQQLHSLKRICCSFYWYLPMAVSHASWHQIKGNTLKYARVYPVWDIILMCLLEAALQARYPFCRKFHTKSAQNSSQNKCDRSFLII